MNMDFDDKLLHYLLVLGGLFVGIFVKRGAEIIADKFWKKELK